jgi:sigma-B regulation protein RsbU (phosphoserine phosphatase)
VRPSETARPEPPLAGHVLAELLPIARELSAVLDPEALLPAIARHVRRIVDYRILDIFLPEPDGGMAPAYADGYEPGSEVARLRLRPGQGVVGAAATRREPVFVPDVTQDPRYVDSFPGVRAELAIPLLHGDQLVGVLNVEGPDAAAFHADARMALQVLAGHLAVAIQNATLYRETRWYAGLLATLHDVGKETASILDLDELLQRVAEVVKRVIDYETFGIFLVDDASGDLVLRKAVSWGAIPEKTRIKISEGLTGAAALTRQPILVGDVRLDPRYLELLPHTRSELVVPLVHKDRLVGVFDLESAALDRFNEEHVKMLTPLASQVAVAIENAALVDRLRSEEDRVHKELQLARWVQHSLFPEEPPAVGGWEAAARFRPARELGGDLYDFYDLAEGVLGVSLGDVSGKGVPAALLAAFCSGSVRARAFERRPPADLLTRVNRTLRRRGVEGFYCTLTYAIFDRPQMRVTLAGSGLPYPLVYRAKERCTEVIEIAGLPLGTFDGSTYDERVVDVLPGDVVVLYTDGLTDARRAGEDYGLARLRAQVEEHAGLDAEDLSDRLVEDVERFMGTSHRADDLTLVVVKTR